GNTTVLTGEYPIDYDDAERAVNDPSVLDTGLAFLNLAVDLGAYEYQPNTSGGACPGDLDNSGSLDFGDLLLILSGWGQCPE
ncbi:MAG: hypothetical protein KJO18_10570, partial [Acidimicrobiia bacterium]|nr:hypothetical protein [Acidimicrobiia bacterium]